MKNYEAAARALAVDLDGTEQFWDEWKSLSFRVLRAVGVDPHAEVAPRRFQVGDRVRATFVPLSSPTQKFIREFNVEVAGDEGFEAADPNMTYRYEWLDDGEWTYELIEEAQ